MVISNKLQFAPIQHRVAIAGQVALGYKLADQQDWTLLNQQLAQVQVSIIDGPSTFRRHSRLKAMKQKAADSDVLAIANTAADGSFYFVDLPAGDYTLRANLPYRSTRWQVPEDAKVTVTDTHPTAWMNLIFPTTGVIGKVMQGPKDGPSAQAAPKTIAPAHIRVKESDEKIWTDRNGHFQLLNLEAPDPKSQAPPRQIILEITADGYEAHITEAHDIHRGTVGYQDIYLTPKTAQTPSS